MNSRKLMKIQDAFLAKDGAVVVAGAEAVLDGLSEKEIESRVGSSVLLELSGKLYAEAVGVLGVKTSLSLVGRRNVFLKLDLAPQNAKDLVGCDVVTK